MSNTDGEDTLENRIWKAVQSQPNFSSVSTDYINHWRSFLDKELASLREQLVKLTNECEHHAKRQYHLENYYNEQLKQQEDVIRELIPIAEERLRRIVNYDMPDYYKVTSEIKTTIKKAKSLTTKDK